jgi:catechol 2,3-dioxygenase
MEYTIPAGTKIGYVHLKVSDLDRAEAFYRDVLGFEVQQHYDSSAAFLSAGGYHHHIGLNIWQSRGGPPPAPGTTGLFHLAILHPTRADLATAVKRVLEHGVPLTGASDHGVSEAIYLHDPDAACKHRSVCWNRHPASRDTSRAARCLLFWLGSAISWSVPPLGGQSGPGHPLGSPTSLRHGRRCGWTRRRCCTSRMSLRTRGVKLLAIRA